jgi:hypothetical protein
MPESSADFRPGWMKRKAGKLSSLEDMPDIVAQQELAPRLPTRIVPATGGNSVSAATLQDSLHYTQKIVNYSAFEAVFGPRLDFADLRSVDAKVLKLGKLYVEPFEEGSFVIPAQLSEETIDVSVDGRDRSVSARDVLARFVEVMEGVASGVNFAVSMGMVQAIEELGKITRKEASRIEYFPVGFAGHASKPRRVVVNKDYLDTVIRYRIGRQSPMVVNDTLEGTLTAIDLVEGKFKLRMADRTSVPGTYMPLMKDAMIQSLDRRVRITGVVEYKKRHTPTHIRALAVEALDEE